MQTLDKIRLALGGRKNSRTAGNIALVERLFMRALDGEKGQRGTRSAYSIKRDDNGDLFVDVEEDILTGVPEKDVPKTLSNIIQNKFHNLIQANGQNIVVNQKTNREWRMSKNAKYLRANDYQAYTDKIQAFNNADEILVASKNYVGEALKHSRNDDFVEFARGVVNFRVVRNGYSADVIVGITKTGRSVLYDIINLQKKQITDSSNTSQNFRQADRNDESVTDTTVAQNSFGVNSYDMQNADKNSQYSFSSENDVQNTLDTINSYVDDEAVTVDAKEENSQAIPNLEDIPDAETVVGEDSEKAPEQMQREQSASEDATEKEKMTKRHKKRVPCFQSTLLLPFLPSRRVFTAISEGADTSICGFSDFIPLCGI